MEHVALKFKGITPRKNLVMIEMAATMPITDIMKLYDGQDKGKAIISAIHWTDFTIMAYSGSEGCSDLKRGDKIVLHEQSPASPLSHHIKHEDHPDNIHAQFKIPVGGSTKEINKIKEAFNEVLDEGVMFTVKVYAMVEDHNIQAIVD